MKNRLKCLLVGITCTISMVSIEAQEIEAITDSSQWIQLKDVVVFSNSNLEHLKQEKPLSSIDEYLASSSKMNMIKRGAYAWEPNLNGMSSERLSVTIDGMQIFGACTDKMDPITSYVDVSNLSEAHISSGQSGNEYGNTIGGGLDLKVTKHQFISRGLRGMVEAGIETNNNLKIGSASFDYSQNKFYFAADASYRDADNYTDGEGNEVLYSQFSKINGALNAGYKIDSLQSIHSTFIYDKATDVGYPALTMDVSLAEAYIASLSYNRIQIGDFSNWETKIYWNDITHVMDDTTRPDVAIHMDMPGWSETWGAYSKIEWHQPKHNLKLNLNGYLNNSLAEMTMYPEDINENSMFMLTWPDVQTLNTAIYVVDAFRHKNWEFEANVRLARHANEVKDEFGLNSLSIFYPNISADRDQFLMSYGLNVHRMDRDFHWNASLGYGERAASVSEGYGFYLFNSFDNYDYVGNPDLPKEKSWEAQLKLSYEKPIWNIGLEANHFYIQDYIIGEIDADLAPMTIGANGIKIYNNLSSAQISNFILSGAVELNRQLDLNARASYHIGETNEGDPLPLISPLSYRTHLSYHNHTWSAMLQWEGATKQTEFSPQYGEDETPGYNIIQLSGGKSFKFDGQRLILKLGVQNLFDEQYSTFSDWRNIPRMGRNFYIHASYTFN